MLLEALAPKRAGRDYMVPYKKAVPSVIAEIGWWCLAVAILLFLAAFVRTSLGFWRFTTAPIVVILRYWADRWSVSHRSIGWIRF
jgi:hypothetical protein